MSKTDASALDNGSLRRGADARLDVRHSDHVVQFYVEDAALLDGLSRSISDAIGAGQSAVVIATRSHLDGLARRLQMRELDMVLALEKGQYIPLDAGQTLSKFMLEGWPDAALFAKVIASVMERAKSAAESSNHRIFAFGEMVALLWSEGKSESALRLEQLWNELATKYAFSLHCAYPMMAFDREEHGETFRKICAEDGRVIPAENYMELADEEQRLRDVTSLQQKALALQSEKAGSVLAEKSLRSRDAEVLNLLENALEGILQTGADQRIKWANKALMCLLGYEAEELIGRHLAKFYVDQRIFEDFWKMLTRHEDIYDFAAELRCKDGAIKHVLIHCDGLWDNENLVHTRSFIRDITERKEMELALVLAHEELEARVKERTNELNRKNLEILKQSEALELTNRGLCQLSARLMQVQDEERRRIARELHDNAAQSLALLSMNLSTLKTEAINTNPDLCAGLSENIGIVKQISTELRTLSYFLHPPLLDEIGLESALRWYVDGFGQRSNIKVSLELPYKMERLSRNLEISIFRIVQECLTNIHLHANSPTATIRLSLSTAKITLEIKDEGKGIAPEKLTTIASTGLSGLGLRGIRQRIKDFQGDMEIISNEKGTEIKVIVPLAIPA